MKNLLRLANCIAVGGCLLILTSVASADRPLIERTLYDEGTASIANCGTFLILDQYTISSTLILFFDHAGNVDHFVEHNFGTDMFRNSVTGKTLNALPFHNTVRVDQIGDPGTITGIIFRVVIPGAGAVLLDVGRFITEAGDIIFEAGPHQFFEGDLTAVCAALE